jgi:ABC-type transport system involved in cytochrome c biogenesis permease component
MGETATGVVILIVCAPLYLLPWLVALWRSHHQTMAIFALNLLLGWTVLGWIAALIWALTVTPRR